jgi:hypothetical protein
MPAKSLPEAKAGAGLHGFFAGIAAKAWMPTFVRMTPPGRGRRLSSA